MANGPGNFTDVASRPTKGAHIVAIHLLALDLDGTTLTHERKIHPDNLASVGNALAQGVRVVLASGRIITSMLPFARELGIVDGMICCNGAHVVGPAGEELAHHQLDPAVVSILLDYAGRLGVHVNLYSRERLYSVGLNEWGQTYYRRVSSMHPTIVSLAEAESVCVTKFMIVDDPRAIAGHKETLEKILKDSPVRVTESEPEYLEFLNPKADKASGLQLLAGHFDIARANTAAIGDYLNDLEMIQWAGVSGAVFNAIDIIRNSATYVVKTNDDAGVAQFIDSVVLNQQE